MKYTSQLPLTHLGLIPAGRNAIFYRVETARGGHFVADFGLKSEAARFAIEDARAKGCRHDHTVSTVILKS